VDGIESLMRSGQLFIIMLLSQQFKYEGNFLQFADEAVQSNLMRVKNKERQCREYIEETSSLQDPSKYIIMPVEKIGGQDYLAC